MVTGIGVLFIAIKSGVQYESPHLIRDEEDPEGTTVSQSVHDAHWSLALLVGLPLLASQRTIKQRLICHTCRLYQI